MPLTKQQATMKEAVFNEIVEVYRGASVPRNWKIENFNWTGPSEAFVATIKALEKVSVQLVWENNKNSVRLVKADKSYSKVGTIVE